MKTLNWLWLLALPAVAWPSLNANVVHPPFDKAIEGGASRIRIVAVEAKDHALWVRAKSGAAALGEDFEESSAKLSYTAENRTAEFILHTLDDVFLEPEETVVLQFSNSPEFSEIQQELTIGLLDNEQPWIVDSSFDASALPGHPVTVAPRQTALSPIHAIARQRDGKLLVGGVITSDSGRYRGLVRLLGNGELDSTFLTGTGLATVRGLALDMGGNVYVSATLHEGGNALVKIGPTGQALWSRGLEASDPVVVTPDGAKIIVAGEFTTVGGVRRNSLAALSPDGVVLPSFDIEVNNAILALALQPDGKLLIGGKFTSVEGSPRQRLARLTAEGELDPAFDPGTALSAEPVAIAVQPDGKILVSGHFGMGFSPLGRLHRLNSDGSVDTNFTASLDEPANAISIDSQNRIVLGGSFNRVNGHTRHRLARLLPNGALDHSYDPGVGPNERVNALVIDSDGSYVIGGQFTKIGRSDAHGLARVFSHNSTVTADFADREFNAREEFGEAVVSLQRYGNSAGELVVEVWVDPGNDPALSEFKAWSGEIRFGPGELTKTVVVPLADDAEVELHERLRIWSRVHGETVARSAVITIEDNEIPVVVTGKIPRGPHSYYRDNPSKQMAVMGNKIALGGPIQGADTGFDFRFLGVNVITTDGSPSGFTPASFTRSADGRIHQVAWTPDGKLVVGGEFTSVNGAAHLNLVRLNPDGSIDGSFRSPVTGTVYEVLVQPDGKVLVAGQNLVGDNPNAWSMVRLNTDGTIDSSFTSNINASSYRLQSDGKIVALLQTGKLGRFMPDGSLDEAFQPVGPGIIYLAVLPDDKMLVSGWFTEVHGILRLGLARLNPDGSLDHTFRPPALEREPSFLPLPNGAVLVRNMMSPDWILLNEDGSLNPGFVFRNQGAGNIALVLDDGRPLSWNFDTIATSNKALGSLRFLAPQITLEEKSGTQTILFERLGALQAGVTLPVRVSLLSGDATGDLAAPERVDLTPLVRTQSMSVTAELDDLIEMDEVYRLTVGEGVSNFIAATVDVSILDRNGRPGALRILPELPPRREITRAVVGANGRVLLAGFSDEPVTLFDPETGSIKHITLPTVEPRYIRALAAHGDGFLIGGSLLGTVGMGEIGAVYRINSEGVFDTTFEPTPLNISPRDIFIEPDGTILVAGRALWQTSLPVYHAARLNADGSIKETFRLVENYKAGALLPGGKLVYHSHYDIRAYDLNTRRAAPGFQTIPINTDSIEQIVVSGDQFYVAGWFSEIHGNPATNVVRINADGTLDKTFAPAMNVNNITCIALDPQGRLLIFGVFESANGLPRLHGARLHRDGSTDPAFDPGLSLVSEGWAGLVRSIVPLASGDLLATVNFPNTSHPWRVGIIPSDLPFRAEVVRNGVGLEFRLVTTPTASYVIEASSDLQIWRTLTTTNSSGYQLRLPLDNAADQQFFRARAN